MTEDSPARSGARKYRSTAPTKGRKCIAIRANEFAAVNQFAKDHGVAFNAALRELIRTHPRISLPSILFPFNHE